VFAKTSTIRSSAVIAIPLIMKSPYSSLSSPNPPVGFPIS
jgi:hypothetical protein